MTKSMLDGAATGPTDGSLTQRRARRLRLGRPRITRLRLAVLGTVVVLLVVWAAVAVSSTSTYSAQVLVVADRAIGIPPPNGLDFGDVPLGDSAEKRIAFENNGRVPTGVMILEWGSIRDLLKMDDAFFILDPGDEREVTFALRPPASAEAKRYSGRVIVVRVPWWWPW